MPRSRAPSEAVRESGENACSVHEASGLHGAVKWANFYQIDKGSISIEANAAGDPFTVFNAV